MINFYRQCIGGTKADLVRVYQHVSKADWQRQFSTAHVYFPVHWHRKSSLKASSVSGRSLEHAYLRTYPDNCVCTNTHQCAPTYITIAGLRIILEYISKNMNIYIYICSTLPRVRELIN